jgi:uncharacterized Tic20 family protein
MTDYPEVPSTPTDPEGEIPAVEPAQAIPPLAPIPANPSLEPIPAIPPVEPPPPPMGPDPLSPADERTWAMLAHLSVLANLVTGFLGPVAAFVIYLAFNNRSRYVAYHALQSAIFQLIWWVGGGALIGLIWAITGMLSVVIVGILCIPFAIIATLVFAAMPVISLIYGVVGAVQVSQNQDFRYWLVGDWVRNTLTGE